MVAKGQRREKPGKTEQRKVQGREKQTGETNSPPGWPNLHRAGSGGEEKTLKKRSQNYPVSLSVTVEISSEGSTGEGSNFKFTWLMAEFSWVEGLNSFLAIGWRLPSAPCHVALPDVTAGFIRVCGRKTSSQTEVTLCCALITTRTPHHLCHILPVRSKSQILLTCKGGDFTKVWKSGGGDPWEHFIICLPQEEGKLSPGVFTYK